MAERSADWIKQAMRDLESAKAQKLDGFYEWTCFISQQASGIPAEYIMEVNTLVAREPSVKSVILFGSVIESRATPASDVDIVIVVTKSNRPFTRDHLSLLPISKISDWEPISSCTPKAKSPKTISPSIEPH